MFRAAKSQFDYLGIDHVHFYLENLPRWRKWFEDCLDFKVVGSVVSDTHTEILQHGSIQIRLSSPLSSTSPVAKFLDRHPAGIAEVAFAIEKSDFEDRVIQAWGDVAHRFVSKCDLFPPSLLARSFSSQPNLFTGIDHLVLNVPAGEMQAAAQWYELHMSMQASDRFHIQTERSALKSIVMESVNKAIQIPINEPSTANSQIQEFLDCNRGAGIQHLALHTDDIYQTVDRLKHCGVKFLETSPSILVDAQDPLTGRALLQVFTQPIFDEPTFFFEIIQRQNQAQGFGEGNFQALFEAVEREQMVRSTL